MTDARKIQELKARRRHVDSVPWNVIACQVWRDITDLTDPDAELITALEAFRQRSGIHISGVTLMSSALAGSALLALFPYSR
jgi:hypothetical protein